MIAKDSSGRGGSSVSEHRRLSTVVSGPLARKIEGHRAGLDWNLLKKSSVLTVGTVVARVLGMAFSLVVARAFVPDDYGAIRYILTLGVIGSVVTQPFGQHVIARFVGLNAEVRPGLQRFVTNALTMLAGLLVASLITASVVLGLIGHLSFGVLAIIFGSCCYYAYWGLCRGLGNERRLVAVSVGSNVIQLVVVVFVIYVLDIRSAVLVTTIFGLSYLVPIGLFQVFAPLRLGLRRSLLDLREMTDIVRFSGSIWGSHVGYVAYNSIVVILLERFSGTAAVGIYALAGTLGRSFLFVPEAIATLLMPRVAAARGEDVEGGVSRLMAVSLSVNIVGLVAYMLLVRSFVVVAFDDSYLDGGIVPYLAMAVAMIVLGQHGVLTAVFVGAGEPSYETVSRIIAFAATATVAVLTIPKHGPTGAALAMLAGAAFGLAYYGWVRRRKG